MNKNYNNNNRKKIRQNIYNQGQVYKLYRKLWNNYSLKNQIQELKKKKNILTKNIILLNF